MIMKRFAIVILWILCSLPALGQEQVALSREVDSVYKELKKLEGEERLKAYRPIVNYMHYYQDTVFWNSFFKEFISDARQLHNIEQEGFARELRLQYLFASGEQFRKEFPETKAFLYDNQLWFRYFYVCELNINTHYEENRKEEALVLLKEMYSEAQEVDYPLGIGLASYRIARIAFLERRLQEAEEAAREAVERFIEAKSWTDLSMAYHLLIPILMKQEKYEEIPAFFDAWKETLLRNDEISGKKKSFSWGKYEIILIRFNIQRKELGLAEEGFKRVEEYQHLLPPAELFDLQGQKMQLLEAQQRYKEALVLADSLLTINIAKEQGHSTLYYLAKKGNYLSKLEQYKEALLVYDKYLALSDSLQKVDINAQLDNIRTQYEVDRHIAEKKLLQVEKARNQNYLIFAVAASILLLTLLALLLYNQRIVVRKNRALVRQMQAYDRMVDKLSATENEAKETIPGKEPDKQVLFNQLEQLLATPIMYTAPNTTRKKLASLLNTNERYLFETIREHTGLTFNDYILSLRLEYARKLLSDKTASETIEAIALESGFGSRKTFHRHFKEHYGLTPDGYRHYILENSEGVV